MDQARIAEIVNRLVDMLADTGIDSFDIYDALNLTDYESAFLDLEWLTDMYRKHDDE